MLFKFCNIIINLIIICFIKHHIEAFYVVNCDVIDMLAHVCIFLGH